MKRKALYKIIQAKAMNDMPDILSKINLDSIEIIPETVIQKRAHWNLTHVLSYSVSFAALIIIAVLGINVIIGSSQPNQTPLESDIELIGFQAVSAASLLEGMDITDLSYNVTPLAFTNDEISIIESELPAIDQYLNMLEIALGDSNAISYEAIISDRGGYAFCIQFQSTDLTQNTYDFKFYYNQAETPNQTNITGVMAYDDREFVTTGIMYKNSGAVKSSFRAEVDQDTYVFVEDRSTSSVQAFAYRIVKHGIITNESVLNIESVKHQFRVKIHMSAQGKHLSLQVQKSAGNDAFTIDYEISNDVLESSGQIDVALEYDMMMHKYVYRYNVRNNQNTETTQYQGNRQWWKTTTTTTTENTTTAGNATSGNGGTAGTTTQDGTTTDGETTTEHTTPGNCPRCNGIIQDIIQNSL